MSAPSSRKGSASMKMARKCVPKAVSCADHAGLMPAFSGRRAAGSIFAEIGEVVGGTKPGRQSEEEVTLFKSVGVAVEDLASAELVYRRALAAQPLLAGDAPQATRP